MLRKIQKKQSLIYVLTVMAGIVVPVIILGTVTAAEEIILDYSFECPLVRAVSLGNETYDRVFMTAAPNGGDIGHPALPAQGTQILIPYGFEVTGVAVVPAEKILLGRGYNIEPVARPFPLSANPALISPPKPDSAAYSSDKPSPGYRFRNMGIQYFRGYQILTLKLRPVDYIPLTGELYYYPNLKIIVTVFWTGRGSPLYRGLDIDQTAVAARVDNADMVNTYAAAPKSGSRNVDFIIITIPSLVSFYQPLENYHDANGLVTEIVTTDQIGGTDPDTVRGYIRNRYLTDGVQYVLIGGDDDIIPARDLYVKSWEGEEAYEDSTMPGDIYFSCLDGTYNYDGDDLWGEPTDGEGGGDVDLIAEVYVGRASASNAPEAYTFVLKTLEYLQTENPYLNKVLMSGEHLTFGGFGEYGGYSLDEMIDFSAAHGYNTFGVPSNAYNIEKLYDLTWPGTNSWPSSEIVSAINDGVHIINHYGHCNTDWALKLNKESLVSQLHNDDLCFIYSQGCYAGNFDDAECWAEYATVKTEACAFSAIMNSRYGWGDWNTDGPSQRFHREFLDAIYNPMEAKPELGRANQDSKEDNLYRIDESCMRWCYYELILFGDPTVSFKAVNGIVFGYPGGIPEIAAPDVPTFFEVTVSGAGQGIPSPGSAQLHYIVNGGPLQTVPMSIIEPYDYEAMLPALSCDDELEFYVSIEEANSSTRFYDPAPEAPHHLLVILDTVVAFEDDFETDKGWTVSGGLWQRGIPSGQGGGDLQYGTPDPTGGCNGPNVYGYNLEGDYENLLPEMHLTSPAIDCSGLHNIRLEFSRWLGVEQPASDHASVAISTNGTDWTTLWQNTCTLADLDWQNVTLDISPLADNEPDVYLRWTMGPTNAQTRYCGWNIDDVRLIAYLCAEFVCGDANGNDVVNILDITYIINFLYRGGPAPDPMASANVNNDGAVNILDITYLINFLYKDGPAPNCP
jgi:hypothetical protein